MTLFLGIAIGLLIARCWPKRKSDRQRMLDDWRPIAMKNGWTWPAR